MEGYRYWPRLVRYGTLASAFGFSAWKSLTVVLEAKGLDDKLVMEGRVVHQNGREQVGSVSHPRLLPRHLNLLGAINAENL